MQAYHCHHARKPKATSELFSPSKLVRETFPTNEAIAMSDKYAAKRVVRAPEAQPHLDLDKGQETQPWGTLTDLPISLGENVRAQSIETLNQVLADTITLRDMYKKHHWQVSGPTFYQLHLLFDKHYGEQNELVDTIAERISGLGGVQVAMAPDVAEMTMIRRPPKGRENPAKQITRLLEAHRHILAEAREGAKIAAESGDDGTNDLLVSELIRLHELQVWFLSEHLVSARLD
jgi:starvation-inducible DNA-binding protein